MKFSIFNAEKILFILHEQVFVMLFQQDREAAAKMFKGKKGAALAADIGKRSKTFVPGERLPEKRHEGPTKEDVAAIKVR